MPRDIGRQRSDFSPEATDCMISVLMVIGPTRPGTGVYAAIRAISPGLNSISPTAPG